MAPAADLHVHTMASDGQLPLHALPAAARRAGVSAVAITDHDRVHPGLDGPVDTVDGITLIAGLELRVEARSAIDLLGYAVDPTPALTAELERLQHDRVERGAEIVERVERRLGIELDLHPRPGLGRPHIARAIAAHPDADYDLQGAFEHLIGDHGPCYVPRSLPDLDRGLGLLRESSALVGLAHPLRYDDPTIWQPVCPRIDAIERWYPYDRSVDPALVERAIEAHDLLPTGGSDAHGRTIGRTGPDERAYARFAARLSDP